MASMRPLALQLCPFSDYLQQGIEQRLEAVRWYELGDAEQRALLAARASECRVVATGGHIGCPKPLMEALPGLGLITINGVGFDKVDLALARSRGVRVSNTPDVLTDDVADLAVGMIIGLLRRIAQGDAHVRAGKWPLGELPLGRRVSGSRFGILGLGRIGRAIADRLAAFGEIAYWSRGAKDCPYRWIGSVEELAAWSDVLVVACAANRETEWLVDAGVLSTLGSDSYLVNIARGSVVDEEALATALAGGGIAGAALDVFANEPHVPQSLRDCDRTLLTPHVGSATADARRAMADLVLANIDAFLAGNPLPTPVV